VSPLGLRLGGVPARPPARRCGGGVAARRCGGGARKNRPASGAS